ncbi:MAG: hypothetical protein ABI970_05740 [Chloroflexota bacterium]
MNTWKVAVKLVPNTIGDPDIAAIKYLSAYIGYITDGTERVYIEDAGNAFREVERRNETPDEQHKNDE